VNNVEFTEASCSSESESLAAYENLSSFNQLQESNKVDTCLWTAIFWTICLLCPKLNCQRCTPIKYPIWVLLKNTKINI